MDSGRWSGADGDSEARRPSDGASWPTILAWRRSARAENRVRYANRFGREGGLNFQSVPSLPVTARIAILAVMKSVTALEAKNRFGEVLEAAQRQPVSITRNGRPSVVMVSAESYARRQRMARERLRRAMRRAGEHAVAQGMNEDVLDQLLADES